jgi:hypothetical protein
MTGSFLDAVIGSEAVSATLLGAMLVHMAVAVVVGAVIAYRPWRRLIPRALPPRVEIAQAQTFIAFAGALLVAVIGDSTARAFGLVGLGAFIRFRSGIKDPRDATVMFALIGVGMACGRGLIVLALLAGAFIVVVLLAFDLSHRALPLRVRVGITLPRAQESLPALRAALPGARLVEVPAAGEDPAKVVITIDSATELDAGVLLADLQARGLPGVRAVAVEDD